MDRLSLVALLVLGCDPQPAPSVPPLSRVDAVPAPPKKAVDLADFCESVYTADAAPDFVLPPLDGPADARQGWTWVNVWATWCEPCVAEMPQLLEWQALLRRGSPPVQLQFLSVDGSPQALSGYLQRHDGRPQTMHLGKFDDLQGWLAQLGLDSSTALPLHLFVDGDDKLRCVRMGEVPSDGLGAVQALLTAG